MSGVKYRQLCPVSKAAAVLGKRWTLLFLRERLFATTRFTDSPRPLFQILPILNQLVDDGLVLRKTSGGKRMARFLTATGKALGPIGTKLAV